MSDKCSPEHASYYIPDDCTENFMDEGSTRILQCDGNDSISSSSSLSSLASSSSSSSIHQVEDQFSALPKIYSANARSVFPKFDDLIKKLLNHTIDVVQISETWQDVNKKEHNDKIDVLENKFGYKWHSFARPKYRDNGTITGGGGSAVLVNQRNFTSSTIEDIVVPQNIEIIWVKVIPKHKSDIKMFIFCGIYSKPYSKTKTALNDHIAANFHLLKMRYEGARFFFLGDFNDFKPDMILHLSPQLRQTVHYPTYGSSTLDLCVTDAHMLYLPPVPEPKLLPDDPSLASPSDHLGNLFLPRRVKGISNNRQYKNVIVRPITNSQLAALGKWISNENWDTVISEKATNMKLDVFTNMVFTMLDVVAPTKSVKISCDDPAWMNSRIKALIRKRNRAYVKNPSSSKYKSLKKKCEKLCKSAKKEFADNFVRNLKDKDPKTWISSMKKLGRANHEKESNTWQFINEVKTNQELCDEISHYFADISGSFAALDRNLLPFIPPPDSPFVSEVECFPHEYEIYNLLKSSKKTASVPHDFPITFLKEFLPELSKPVHDIYCHAIASGTFPSRWKNEYVSPLPKVIPPASPKDLRNLSLTEFLSKAFERFLLNGTSSTKGLLHYVRKYIDPNQFAVAGSSCSHALIKMIDFILLATDDPSQPTAVVNLLADWSKAFNKCNHNIIMRILIAMKVPTWLLRLLMSYLENRKMILRFRGCVSDPQDIPGGMPQGTLLGVILYILYINPVGFPSEATIKISDVLHDYWNVLDSVPTLPTNTATLPLTIQSVKFMDDATLQETINLKTQLATNLDRSGPLPSWELGPTQTNCLVLPKQNTELQHQIEIIKHLSDSREMALNTSKTCIFIVNFTKNYQFRPLLKIPGCESIIDRVQETKLLGYWFSTNMKTDRHVQHILTIAYKRIWTIRKLKKAGISDEDILYFYFIKIRSVLESNCVAFHSLLTKENSENIERIQKIVLRIIMNEDYFDYHHACLKLDVQTLASRRVKLCLSFSLKCLESDKHKHLFKLNKQTNIRNPDIFAVPYAHTSRYFNSPKVYLTRLLNEHFRNLQSNN